ncbi:MAG: Holliday junction resolvase RuvX [Atribacterota bacterium]
MKRILALDIGERRIGVAFNRGGPIAFPYGTLEEKGLRFLLCLARELGAEEIVLGWPLRTDGLVGEKAKKIQALKEAMEKEFPGKIVLWDERFSTKEVEKRLIEAGVKRKRRKETVDQLAAALILQNYLDRGGQ